MLRRLELMSIARAEDAMERELAMHRWCEKFLGECTVEGTLSKESIRDSKIDVIADFKDHLAHKCCSEARSEVEFSETPDHQLREICPVRLGEEVPIRRFRGHFTFLKKGL